MPWGIVVVENRKTTTSTPTTGLVVIATSWTITVTAN